ncbi:hypothetical protein [Virgibacillus salinus]|uniref:Uncharacterized protein n=1 Tax=Virgibacillus salinus TaxID=553311 RepID=A0A1H0ZBY0_9BACI|nr:hypothetical protein [Virgibacillus salinus]SDQ24914.1 hypothetical protein SAMN05216231_1139 [Virgibacillus salinus]
MSEESARLQRKSTSLAHLQIDWFYCLIFEYEIESTLKRKTTFAKIAM